MQTLTPPASNTGIDELVDTKIIRRKTRPVPVGSVTIGVALPSLCNL